MSATRNVHFGCVVRFGGKQFPSRRPMKRAFQPTIFPAPLSPALTIQEKSKPLDAHYFHQDRQQQKLRNLNINMLSWWLYERSMRLPR